MSFPEEQKTVLVTGGAGFIGSNFIPFFLDNNENYRIVNLDSLTYAGNLDNLQRLENSNRYSFIKGDICDKGLVKSVFREYSIDAVIHFAAESHVDNSITAPAKLIKTNVEGTFTLLEAARHSWGEKKGKQAVSSYFN